MAKRRASSVFVILLFVMVFLVPVPQISLPQMVIPKISVLPFNQITIPRITIPALNLPSISNLPRVNAVTATLTLNPNSGVAGGTVNVIGSGYGSLANSGSCGLTSSPSNIFTSSSCSIDATGALSGTFIISSTVPGRGTGGYTVTATDQRTGNVGATGVAPFSVLPAATVNPTRGTPPITGSPGAPPNPPSIGVSGTGFSVGDTTGCTITSSSVTLIITQGICTINTSTGQLSGSFSVAANSQGGVGEVPIAIYVVGPSGDQPAGTAIPTFTVFPNFLLSPTSDPVGSTINFAGSGFAAGDNGCYVTSTTTGTGTALISTQLCTATGATGSFSGSFVVASGAAGTYTVAVTGYSGSTVSAQFIVQPTLTLNPTTGPIWTVVTASGSTYAGTTCNLAASPSSLFSTTPSCTIASDHTLSGGFTVAPGASAMSYKVTVTTDVAADTSSATFTVTTGPGPTFTLSSSSGLVGSAVTVSGSSYAGTTCTLASSPSELFSSSTCTISSGTLSGSFTVASSASPSGYTVTVTTNVVSDTKSATFTVIASTLFLNPASAPGGIAVTVSGLNYQGTACTLASFPSGLLTSSTCTVSSGTLSGAFTVASAASLGGYLVTVTTNVAADTRSATFSVTAGPPPPTTFSLSPTSGPTGTVVTASGSNYLGTTCGLSSSPSGLFSSATCSVSGGSLSGGFVVASGVSPGSYSVTVATSVVGDTKSATFTVPAPTFTLSPTVGDVGTSVTASGLNYAGTTCSLSATPSKLFTSSSCNISGGSLSGGFTVASSATGGSYTVTVTTNITGETKSATFTVQTTLPTCLIATATFGSATAPAVQFLRNFRDHQILSTSSGTAFMQLFNAWYYSFSPNVAGYLSTHAIERTVMKGTLYPLIGILEVSSLTFSATSVFPEFAALISGLVASSLIGAVYLGLPLSVVRARIRRLRGSRAQTLERILAAMLLGGLAVLVVGELLASPVLLMMSSATVVLSALFLSAAFTSGRIARKLQAL